MFELIPAASEEHNEPPDADCRPRCGLQSCSRSASPLASQSRCTWVCLLATGILSETALSGCGGRSMLGQPLLPPPLVHLSPGAQCDASHHSARFDEDPADCSSLALPPTGLVGHFAGCSRLVLPFFD